MYLCYDEAVQVGLNAYRRLEYGHAALLSVLPVMSSKKRSVFRSPPSSPNNG